MADKLIQMVPEGPTELARYISQSKAIMEAAKPMIEHFYNSFMKWEDHYRDLAAVYHFTNITARNRADLTTDALKQLREAFELKGKEDYYKFLIPWMENKKLVDVCRNHTQHPESDPWHLRLQSAEVFDFMTKVKQNLGALNAQVNELQTSLLEVTKTNTILLGSLAEDSWKEPNPDSKPPAPRYMCPEWELFRDWLKSLPETQKSLSCGRSLGDIASKVLYQPDEVELSTLMIDFFLSRPATETVIEMDRMQEVL